MVNWVKKVEKFKENQLTQGENVLSAVFFQPVGAMGEATGKASLGLIGTLISHKMTSGKKQANKTFESKMSKSFPDGGVVVAVTSGGRILVYEHSAMSGKPKKLIQQYEVGDFKVDSAKKGMLKTDVTLSFKDGGLKTFELAKGQNLDDFTKSLV